MTRKLRQHIVLSSALGCLLSVSSAIADTSVYIGRAKTEATINALPLASGATAVGVTASGQAAMTGPGDPVPILLEVRCNGLGLVETADKQQKITGYCRLSESEEDAFDLRMVEHDGKAEVTIIGGSGRWANASGSGSFKRQESGPILNISTFEFTITAP